MIIAPPAAWSTRAATRTPTDGAAAHSAEPSGEDRQPDEEHALAPDPVGEPPGRHEQRREDDRVRVQDPGEVGERGAGEVPGELRERDVDDEEVEARDEDAERGDEEDPPALVHRVPPE